MKMHKALIKLRQYKKVPSKNKLPHKAFYTAEKSMMCWNKLEHELMYLQDLYTPPEGEYERGIHACYSSILNLVNTYKREIEDDT